MDTTQSSWTAFAVPRTLSPGRKRRANASYDSAQSSFVTIADVAAFANRGDVHESRFYGEIETCRQTLVTPGRTSPNRYRPTLTRTPTQSPTHLIQLLVIAMETHRLQVSDPQVIALDNARRRLSKISVLEHEHYLLLYGKICQAQQVHTSTRGWGRKRRNAPVFCLVVHALCVCVFSFSWVCGNGVQRGLPNVLALPPHEAAQWQTMKRVVANEQVEFIRAMAGGLAVISALHASHVPSFAASWARTNDNFVFNFLSRVGDNLSVSYVVQCNADAVLERHLSSVPTLV